MRASSLMDRVGRTHRRFDFIPKSVLITMTEESAFKLYAEIVGPCGNYHNIPKDFPFVYTFINDRGLNAVRLVTIKTTGY